MSSLDRSRGSSLFIKLIFFKIIFYSSLYELLGLRGGGATNHQSGVWAPLPAFLCNFSLKYDCRGLRIGNPPHPPRLWDWPSHIPAITPLNRTLHAFLAAALVPHELCSTMRSMEHRETARSAHRYLLIIFFNSNTCF